MGDIADYYGGDNQWERQRHSHVYSTIDFSPGHPALGVMFYDEPMAIVGLPYSNPDGSSRQDAAGRLIHKQLIAFVREPDNAYDPNAIAAYEVEWKGFPQFELKTQLGYLPKGIAANYAPLLDAGAILFGVVEATTPSKKYPDKVGGVMVRTGIMQVGRDTGNAPVISQKNS